MQYDLLIEELLVLNGQAMFCWLSFFVGIKKRFDSGLIAHSPIATPISNHPHPPSQLRASMLSQLRRGGMRVGNSFTVKVGDIDEKIREGGSRRIRK